MTMKNKKRGDLEKSNETAVKTVKILEVLTYEPVAVQKIINRVGEIPNVKGQLQLDSTNRILTSLKLCGYVTQDAKTKLWMRTHKRL